MKAATGELNLTLITVVALGALLALFTGVMWPTLRNRVVNQWNNTNNVSVDKNGVIKTAYNFDENIDFIVY